jgi:hypothetical protein
LTFKVSWPRRRAAEGGGVLLGESDLCKHPRTFRLLLQNTPLIITRLQLSQDDGSSRRGDNVSLAEE